MNIADVYKAETVKECIKLLAKHKETKIISGGTDLVIKLNEGQIEGISLVDISSIKELNFVKIEGNTIHIGSNSTFSDVLNHKSIFPKSIKGFVEALESVGSPQIRNAGTIGGNICNGSPAADSIPPLIVLGAKLTIISKKRERIVDIEDFFLGKGKVDLGSNELLKSISFDIPNEDSKLNFYKYSYRNALSITLGSVAALIDIQNNIVQDIKIATGGFSAYCIREREMEELMIGKELNEENLNYLLNSAKKIVQKRIETFPNDFKVLKNITIEGALRHVIR
ncbi:FAD binding domain-containing protein [Mycoplasmatota bacterium]|nr:FAD binding domain-containing protein [Mycoplasmatota bacterium]